MENTKLYEIIHGNSADILPLFKDCSFDSLITDPPAGINLIGLDWDSDKGGRDQWIHWLTQIMCECNRILKPGAHGLIWALPRTSHWTATALEDAGFEIRDIITHVFASGFPKSVAIDKAIRKIDIPAAESWTGWGTALKPSNEHWILVRKPIAENNVSNNILKFGTGALNIDESRVPTSDKISSTQNIDLKHASYLSQRKGRSPTSFYQQHSMGRFPANTLFTSIDLTNANHSELDATNTIGLPFLRYFKTFQENNPYFYCSKAAKKEKGDGNTHPTVKPLKLMKYLCKLITPTKCRVLDPFMGSGTTGLAAIQEGFQFTGIEKNARYYAIAESRLNQSHHATSLVTQVGATF